MDETLENVSRWLLLDIDFLLSIGGLERVWRVRSLVPEGDLVHSTTYSMIQAGERTCLLLGELEISRATTGASIPRLRFRSRGIGRIGHEPAINAFDELAHRRRVTRPRSGLSL